MRLLVLGALLALGGCGGGGTTGTNYSDAPPMAEIVGTPAPRASETPEAEAAEVLNSIVADNATEAENAAGEAGAAPENAAE